MRRAATSTFLAILLALSPSTAFAAQQFRYAGQWSTTTKVSGVDGYIRVSGTIMVDPDHNHHMSFFALCPTTACSQWVQVGQFQGILGQCPGSPCVQSTEFVHGFWENKTSCGAYEVADTGDEHLDPNVPYYVNYVGTGFSPCNLNQPKFAFRKDRIDNPPDGYGYMSSSIGIPIAETELLFDPFEGEALNQDRFGLNDNNQVQSGYGISVLKSGTWKAWTEAWAPGTATFQDWPLRYYGVRAYYAFRTDDQ